MIKYLRNFISGSDKVNFKKYSINKIVNDMSFCGSILFPNSIVVQSNQTNSRKVETIPKISIKINILEIKKWTAYLNCPFKPIKF